MTAGAGEWEVLLSAPADVGDFGLHQDADVAAAAFRRQFAREFDGTPAVEHGAAAEAQFRRARQLLVGRPVLWSGFLMLMTPAALGVPVEAVVGGQAGGSPEELARMRALAEVPAMFVVQLSVQVGRLAPYVPGAPMSQAAALARALRGRYGENAGVHQVRYGTVEGVATVRTVEQDVAGTPFGTESFTADSAPLEHLLAEVSLIFPEEEALVTVTAGATHGAALQDAVLLAGSIAQTVRVRRAVGATGAGPEEATFAGAGAVTARAADAGDGVAGPPAGAGAADVPDGVVPAPAEAAADDTEVAARLSVLLPDGSALPPGRTLLGRSPRRTAQDADHSVTVADHSVSRTHLLLRVDAGRAWATDLASSNGTMLQRGSAAPVRLAPGVGTELAAGDVVNLGAVILRVVQDGTDEPKSSWT